MNKQQVSHDILNTLERLRIMHDLLRDQKYEMIPRDELLRDLDENLTKLRENFDLFKDQ